MSASLGENAISVEEFAVSFGGNSSLFFGGGQRVRYCGGGACVHGFLLVVLVRKHHP